MAYRPTEATRATKQHRTVSLHHAALELVSEAGFGAASVKAIAVRAGVSAGTVYTYFGSREELLAEVFRSAAGTELERVRSAIAAVGEDGAAQEIAALVDTFARRAFAGQTLAWALLIEPAGELIDTERLWYRGEYAAEAEAIVTRGIAAGELPAQRPDVVGPGLIGLISEALTGPLSPEGALPTDHLVSEVTHMCLRAVGGSQ